MAQEISPEATITIRLFVDNDLEPGGMVQINHHSSNYSKLMLLQWAIVILSKHMSKLILDI